MTDEKRQDHAWRNGDVLRELYHERGMTVTEIGDELGCAHQTVVKWLDRNNIETRDLSEGIKRYHASQPAPYHVHEGSGYVYWLLNHTEKRTAIAIHRLLAVAEYGFGEVANNVVHHKNGVPWDNRPGNIEVMSQSEHAQIHDAERIKDEEGKYV